MTIYDVNDRNKRPPHPMRVFVDGVEIHRVVYVDTEKGVVRYHKYAPLHPSTPPPSDEYPVAILTGVVTLEPIA